MAQLRKVKPTGPQPAAVMLIGERPGKMENAKGYCFCGPAGQELDRYLTTCAGISRDNVRVTNLVPTYSEDPPSAEEIEANLPDLIADVERTDPSFVGLVGLHAARVFIGPDIDMEWSHGLLFPSPVHYLMMPLYHPAAGLHMPSIAAKVAWDFTQFGKLIRGAPLPTGHLADAIPDPSYSEVTGMVLSHSPTALDTEGSSDHPWGWSASCRPGKAAVGRKGATIAVKGAAVLHNAIHDLPVLDALGVRIDAFTDTMIMAALLGTEPLSLKALARRHVGMTMAEYSDVVRDAQRELALLYLSRAVDFSLNGGH